MNLRIEEGFEDAVVSFLGTISGFTIFKGFNDDNLITPRIEIEIAGLEFLETLDQMNGQALPEYAKFDLQLNMRVITNMDDGTSRSDHYEGLNAMRQKFLRSADNFTTANLPDYDVKYLRMTGSANAVDGGMRVTESTYSIRASILETFDLAFAFSSDIGITTVSTTLSIRILDAWHPHITTGNDYEVLQYQMEMSYEQDATISLPTEGTSGDNYTWDAESRPLVIALAGSEAGLEEGTIYEMHTLNTSNENARLMEIGGSIIGWTIGRGTRWETVKETGAVLASIKLKDTSAGDQWIGTSGGITRGVDWQVLR